MIIKQLLTANKIKIYFDQVNILKHLVKNNNNKIAIALFLLFRRHYHEIIWRLYCVESCDIHTLNLEMKSLKLINS